MDHHRRQLSSTSTASRAPTSPRIRSSGSRAFTAAAAPPLPASLLPPAQQDDDDKWHRSTPPPRRGSPSLPFYTPGGGGGAGGGGGRPPGALLRSARGFHGGLTGRLRGSRIRWVVLLALAAGVLLWRSSSGSSTGGRAVAHVPGNDVTLQSDNSAAREQVARPRVDKAKPDEPPDRPPSKLDEAPVKPAGRPAAPSRVDSAGPIDVRVRPASLSTAPESASVFQDRYLAYSPHSGYHNQRISLENALTLAYLLRRTLLVPPVWLGHAIPYISFDKLQRRLEMATKEGLEHCIEWGDGPPSQAIPRECNGFWDWTTVDWSFLVDLTEAEKLVPIRPRWNMSLDALAADLDLAKPNRRGVRSDVFALPDDTMYQYRLYDSPEDDDPLDKWTTRVDVDQLRRDSDPYKLVHLGSMFGTNRMRLVRDEGYEARGAFRRAMVFRTPEVDEVTEEIRDLLGGAGRYYGLHLRVGDGIFQQNAAQNMRGVWDKLCAEKMKLDPDVCDQARRLSEADAPPRVVRRDEVATRNESAAANAHRRALSERANARPQREGAYHHAPLPPLPEIRSTSDSPLSSTLTCRRPLHTETALLPFNAPLFIATDSKLAADDPNLQLFFSAFPCTFVLSDFGGLDSLGRLNRLRNAEDKTPLAQFLYPQLDAQIAAWGRGLVGTPQSTYSRFAIDVLHQVYHGWDIIERG